MGKVETWLFIGWVMMVGIAITAGAIYGIVLLSRSSHSPILWFLGVAVLGVVAVFGAGVTGCAACMGALTLNAPATSP